MLLVEVIQTKIKNIIEQLPHNNVVIQIIHAIS